MNDLELLMKGALVGHLVGDSLGYPYRDKPNITNCNIEFITGPNDEPIGAYTAAGSFTLATMSSFNESEELDLEDIMDKFNDVFMGGYLCPDEEPIYVLPSIIQAVSNHNNGMPPDKCGVSSKVLTCEPLLRMMPVAMVHQLSDLDEIVKVSHEVCSLTQSDEKSQVACAVYSLIMRNLLLQRPEKVIDQLNEYYKANNMELYWHALEEIVEEKQNPNRGTKDISDCLWTAWACFANNEEDFESCIIDAIRFGNDTNCTAALAGSFSGAANGLNSIPTEWLDAVILSAEAMDSAQSFIDTVIEDQSKLT